MKKTNLLLILAAVVAAAILALPTVAEDAPGKVAFEAAKCSMCHAVSTVGIEAKTKSAAMAGPDLVDVEVDAAALLAYLKQETEIEGKKHKKKWTGSDDDAKAVIDWILEQKSDG